VDIGFTYAVAYVHADATSRAGLEFALDAAKNTNAIKDLVNISAINLIMDEAVIVLLAFY